MFLPLGIYGQRLELWHLCLLVRTLIYICRMSRGGLRLTYLEREQPVHAHHSCSLRVDTQGGSHLAPYVGGVADEVSMVAPARETWMENRQGNFFFFFKIYLSLAALSLHCFAQTFSNWQVGPAL